MKTIISLCLFLISSALYSPVLASSEYTLGGSYNLVGQNTLSEDPTFDLNLSLIASVFRDETHEYGLTTSYSVNWQEATRTELVSENSSFLATAFYRYHFLISSDDAPYPQMLYLGPNIGYAEAMTPSGQHKMSLVVGASLGVNFFIAKDFALDFLILDANKVLDTDRLLLNQGIGFRFFF